MQPRFAWERNHQPNFDTADERREACHLGYVSQVTQVRGSEPETTVSGKQA